MTYGAFPLAPLDLTRPDFTPFVFHDFQYCSVTWQHPYGAAVMSEKHYKNKLINVVEGSGIIFLTFNHSKADRENDAGREVKYC